MMDNKKNTDITSQTRHFDAESSSFSTLSTYNLMEHQPEWMPTLQSYFNTEPTMNPLTSARKVKNRPAIKVSTKQRAKPIKTIRHISASELAILERSYRNDVNYKSSTNCKKLALKVGLNNSQVRRWFMSRKEKDKKKSFTLSKLELSENSVIEVPVSTTGQINCKQAAENTQPKPEDRAYMSSSKSDQAQLWLNYPNLRPPVNELYLSNISDDLLIRFQKDNFNSMFL